MKAHPKPGNIDSLDAFDDVDIDNVGDLSLANKNLPTHSSLGYLYRKNRSVQNIRSTHALVNNHSHDEISTIQRFIISPNRDKKLPHPPSTGPHAANTTDSAKANKPSYSPSKKLKQKRQLQKKDLDNLSSAIDNSDDELDSSTIIFDVPLSQSLSQLAAKELPIQSKLLSFTSETTKDSSLMSYDHKQSDQESDLDFDMLSTEAKRLTFEFSQSKEIRTIQESALRRHTIAQMEKAHADDTLPASKLKQSLVTITRPSYLPPKSKTECAKHLREVKDLKNRAIHNELRLEKKTLKQLQERKCLKEKDLKKWENEIIPNFNEKIQLSSTRELWWRGIPMKYRNLVWSRLISTKTIDSNNLLLLKKKSLDSITENTEIVQSIQNDITKVFPDLGVFQTSLQDQLLFVLTLYSHYATYKSSISRIAAALLYSINDVDKTFLALVGLLQRPLLRSIYSSKVSENDKFQLEVQSFLRTFSKKNPSLYHHFHENLKIEPDDYVIPLLQNLFTNVVSLEVASSIIDVYAFEGDSMLWRCILGLFEKIGYKLYGNKQEILNIIGDDALEILNHDSDGHWYKYLDVGDEVDFMGSVRQVLKNSI